jgi:molecular chaperone DnaK (HSP70)
MKTHPSVVGIDLGSSYTKLAFRKAMHVSSKAVHEQARMVPVGGAVLIPSLVVDTKDDKTPWICGNKAYKLKPKSHWQVHDGWKQALFRAQANEQRLQAKRVAVVYLQYLRVCLEQANILKTQHVVTRVALPALEAVDHALEALREAFVEVVWRGSVEFVQEPAANVVGTLSGGRNVLTRFGTPNLGSMIGPHGDAGPCFPDLFNMINAWVLQKAGPETTNIVVVDVGGFTLDIAQMKVDKKLLAYEGKLSDACRTVSYDLGVSGLLDANGIQALARQKGVELHALEHETRALLRANVYNGVPYVITKGATHIAFGKTKDDKALITAACDGFSEAICKKLSGELCENAIVVLTGGGSAIRRVEAAVRTHVEAVGGRCLLARGDVSSAVNADADDELLGRCATALGGASILL